MILYGLKASCALACFGGKYEVSSRKVFLFKKLAEGYKEEFIKMLLERSQGQFLEIEKVVECKVVDYEVQNGPTQFPPETFLHGWFSQESSEKHGTGIYLDENNNEVHVSEVTKKIEPCSTWNDLKYVGLVKDGTHKPGLPDPSDTY
jgi:hypothetical protein